MDCLHRIARKLRVVGKTVAVFASFVATGMFLYVSIGSNASTSVRTFPALHIANATLYRDDKEKPNTVGTYPSVTHPTTLTLKSNSTILSPAQMSSLDLNCQPATYIMFLKTHKCASSSVQNILMRFGDVHNLTFVLPPDGNYLGHPQKFSPALALPLPSKYSSTSYNIFAHHSRFEENEMRAIMPKDTIYISILKEPAAMFESMYNWVQLDKRYGVSLGDFIENPQQHFLAQEQKTFARNPMMFDFGMDLADSDSPVKIQAKISEIQRRFSLMMLAEFMDESLVLLRQLLCWKWSDLVAFRVNARKPSYRAWLSPSQKNKIRQWNNADTSLYQHFHILFQQNLASYGQEKMERDVRFLRNLSARWYDACVERVLSKNDSTDQRFKVWHDSVSGFLLKKSMVRNATCIRLAMAENPFTTYLRSKLWPFHKLLRADSKPTTNAGQRKTTIADFW